MGGKNQKWKLERQNRKRARGLKMFDLPERENVGTINRLVRDRGYGFIGTGKRGSLFFHCKDLQGVSFDALKEGDEVEFKVIQGGRGPRAVEVKLRTERREVTKSRY